MSLRSWRKRERECFFGSVAREGILASGVAAIVSTPIYLTTRTAFHRQIKTLALKKALARPIRPATVGKYNHHQLQKYVQFICRECGATEQGFEPITSGTPVGCPTTELRETMHRFSSSFFSTFNQQSRILYSLSPFF